MGFNQLGPFEWGCWAISHGTHREKPIFCAARHGQTEMFDFLAKEMKLEKLSPEASKAHLQ